MGYHTFLLEPLEADVKPSPVTYGDDASHLAAALGDRDAAPLLHPAEDLTQLGLRLVDRIGPRHEATMGNLVMMVKYEQELQA